MTHSRYTPRVEMLEDRTVPATLRLIGGNAFISNPRTTTIDLMATGTNSFTMTDGALTVNFNVGGTLFINGSNKADTINVDLAGQTFTGNLFFNTGNGADTVNLITSAAGGTVHGNVTALTGRGNDTLNLNNGGADSLTLRGYIQAIDQLGNDTINFGSDAAATVFLGNVNVLGYNDVNVGFEQADTFAGNLTVRVLPDGNALDFFVNKNVNFDRDVTVTGTQLADVVNFLGPTVVGRNVNVNLGHGGDTITVSDFGAGGAPLTVEGNFYLDMGEGDNSYDLDDTFEVFGDMNIRGGNGQNFVNNFNGSTGGDLRVFFGNGDNNINLATVGLFIGGDFVYRAGNGFNVVGMADVFINGDVDLRLGNGDNIISANDPATIGGRFDVLTGNGNNQFSLIYFTPILLNLNVRFGNGDDTVLMFGATVTGLVDGSGGTNTFIDLGNNYIPPFTLANF